ncbi:BTB/POZ domain-containing protein [Vigna angularis]|uniref:BTB/POZ domain-containing protein n=1 Tax=Phaseolus angularis TaxID=3914 RepID=A0A8T0KLV1_PHAAN|nr:BTB/POZ domain-containing protein [Vigna angularis]
MAAKFCYGVKIDLSPSNVVVLRCVGEFLEMTEDFSEDNLVSKEEPESTELISSKNGNPNESSYLLSKPSSCSFVEPASNIDRFLGSTTPLESFKEWSAYGAGVPLVLDQRQSVVQYYVPYLSAIQLYGQSNRKSNTKSRYTSEDNDGDYYRDSSSDGSSDSEFGKKD